MKKIRFLIYGVVGVFSLGFIFLVSVFFQSSIEKISGQNIKTEIQKLKDKEIEFVELKKSYRDWQRVDKIYNRFKRKCLYSFNGFSDFKNDFESLLSRHFFEQSPFSYNIKNVDRNIVMVSIDFKGSGDYRNIKRFLYEIEKRERMVFLKNLELVREKNRVEVKFNLEVYFVR
jgi:Tfp pilus assembly protein PilO